MGAYEMFAITALGIFVVACVFMAVADIIKRKDKDADPTLEAVIRTPVEPPTTPLSGMQVTHYMETAYREGWTHGYEQREREKVVRWTGRTNG